MLDILAVSFLGALSTGYQLRSSSHIIYGISQEKEE